MQHIRQIGLIAFVVLGNFLVLSVFFWPPTKNWFLITLGLAAGAVPALGMPWVFYDVVRYEKRPWPHVLLSLVPYWFIWHYFERVRKRNPEERRPAAFR